MLWEKRGFDTQIKIEYGEQSQYIPIRLDGFWICNCGYINRSDEKNCHHCQSSKEKIFNFDEDQLNKRKTDRLNNEKYIQANELLKSDQIASLDSAKYLLEDIADCQS